MSQFNQAPVPLEIGKAVEDLQDAISTLRDVPLAIAVSDWSAITGGYKATFLSDYITENCKWDVTYDASYRTYAKNDFIADLKSGGGGIEFITATIPTGTITGNIRVIAANDGTVPVIIEDTVVSIANGGTGQSSLAGAKQALGITALENNQVNHNTLIHSTYFGATGSETVDCSGYRYVLVEVSGNESNIRSYLFPVVSTLSVGGYAIIDATAAIWVHMYFTLNFNTKKFTVNTIQSQTWGGAYVKIYGINT